MLLAYEPIGEMARPSPAGVTFLGIELTQTPAWPSMRHVFDLGDEAALHVHVGPRGEIHAFGVSFDLAGDEILRAL